MSDFEMLALLLNTAVSVAFAVEYTDEDLAWFRKPLTDEMEVSNA